MIARPASDPSTDAGTGTPPAPGDRVAGSWAVSAASRAVMRANKGRDTRPELALRSAVHALGLRYRVGVRPVRGVRRTADLVFTKVKVAVFLDGCFWHGCQLHYRPSRRNSEFWTSKIEGNRSRDTQTDRLLRAEGWTVIRIWEHTDPVTAAELVRETVTHLRREPRAEPVSPSDAQSL